MDAMTQYLLAGNMGMSPGEYFSRQYLTNGAGGSSPAAAYIGGAGQHPNVTTLPSSPLQMVGGGGPTGYGGGAAGPAPVQASPLGGNTQAGQNANQGMMLLMQALIKKAKQPPKPKQQQNNTAPEPGANDLPSSSSGAEPGAPDAGSGDGRQP